MFLVKPKEVRVISLQNESAFSDQTAMHSGAGEPVQFFGKGCAGRYIENVIHRLWGIDRQFWNFFNIRSVGLGHDTMKCCKRIQSRNRRLEICQKSDFFRLLLPAKYLFWMREKHVLHNLLDFSFDQRIVPSDACSL